MRPTANCIDVASNFGPRAPAPWEWWELSVFSPPVLAQPPPFRRLFPLQSRSVHGHPFLIDFRVLSQGSSCRFVLVSNHAHVHTFHIFLELTWLSFNSSVALPLLPRVPNTPRVPLFLLPEARTRSPLQGSVPLPAHL